MIKKKMIALLALLPCTLHLIVLCIVGVKKISF